MSEYYNGQQGALRLIADITYGYDNIETVYELHGLIDEVRREALKAILYKEEYNAGSY